jgi:hypothetical protein
VVLGLVVTAIGGTGIFVVFTDRATTGPNTASSGERASAADIQLAIAIPDANGGYACGAFDEHLANPFFTVSDVQPGDGASRMACVPNVGSASVTVTLSSIDLVDENCETAASLGSQVAGLLALTTQPSPLVNNGLAPTETACFEFGLDYPLSTSEETAQVAQSDSVTWRFAFDAATLP